MDNVRFLYFRPTSGLSGRLSRSVMRMMTIICSVILLPIIRNLIEFKSGEVKSVSHASRIEKCHK